MLKISGLLLLATGVLDIVYVLLAHNQQLTEIVQAGVVNAVELTPSQYAREVMFWHLTCGLTFVLLGATVQWSYQRTGRVPLFLGGALLALGIYGVVLVPASGFWLFLPQAILIFIGRYRTRTRAQVA